MKEQEDTKKSRRMGAVTVSKQAEYIILEGFKELDSIRLSHSTEPGPRTLKGNRFICENHPLLLWAVNLESIPSVVWSHGDLVRIYYPLSGLLLMRSITS